MMRPWVVRDSKGRGSTMATFKLAMQADPLASQPSGWSGLEARDLLRNARWFTRIRWAVVLIMLTGGVTGALLPGLLRAMGLDLPVFELTTMAMALALPQESPK